jgi:predicted N-acetyltransferase YhbS
MMEFRPHKPSDASAIEGLFISVFTRSEGEKEGVLIGKLVKDLIASTDSQDLYGFVAVDREQIIGAIFFSRLTFKQRDIDVFILAPVAVHSDHQGKGIGKALITHGLGEMKESGVIFVITYGDPAFYSKVGFRPLSQDVVAAPLELSQPEGWLGQSLTDGPIEAIPGPCSCVQALDNPAYW